MRLHYAGHCPHPYFSTVILCAVTALAGCSQTTTQAPLTTSSLPDSAKTEVSPTPVGPRQQPSYTWNGNTARTATGAVPPPQSPDLQWHASRRPSFDAGRTTIGMTQPPRAPLPASAPAVTGSLGAGRLVEVQQGDTLYSIARRNNVSVAALVDANRLTSPSIQAGQRLALPASAR